VSELEPPRDEVNCDVEAVAESIDDDDDDDNDDD
jgi:hypothetical protein